MNGFRFFGHATRQAPEHFDAAATAVANGFNVELVQVEDLEAIHAAELLLRCSSVGEVVPPSQQMLTATERAWIRLWSRLNRPGLPVDVASIPLERAQAALGR